MNTDGANAEAPDRNLALDLVRVTESAALAASRWMGRGDKEGADGAAWIAARIAARARARPHGTAARDRTELPHETAPDRTRALWHTGTH